MAKQKKHKRVTLTALDSVVAKALNITSQNPSDVKAVFTSVKSKARSVLETFDLTNDMTAYPKITEENQDYFRRIVSESDIMNHISFVRNLMIGSWLNNKNVYRISKEAMEYIESIDLVNCGVTIESIASVLKKSAVYVQFPEGYEYTGFFAGTTNFPNKMCGASPENIPLRYITSAILQKDSAFICITGNLYIPVGQYFNDAAQKDESRMILKVLFYLWFILERYDIFKTCASMQVKQSATYWDISPLPYSFDVVRSRLKQMITIGCCIMMNYISRDNMLSDFAKHLAAESSYKNIAADQIDEEKLRKIMRCYTYQMVLDWEKCRNVYQYDTKTLESFRDKYLSDYTLFGIPKELIRFFPHDTIAILNRDTDSVALISVQKIENTHIDGLVILRDGDTKSDVVIEYLRLAPPTEYTQDEIESEQTKFNIACVVYHILKVYEKRSIQKFVKDTMTAGNPNLGQLVELPPAPEKRERESNPDIEPPSEKEFRAGETLEDIPIDLFDITKRTVKRSDMSELKRRTGWKMTPHTRRPHPHRYWVGSGESRHMEVRWLERMQIHKKQEAPKAVIHELR